MQLCDDVLRYERNNVCVVDVSVRILILHFRFAGIDPDVMKRCWDVSMLTFF